MVAPKLDGPYKLIVDEVKSATKASSCGVWALGSLRQDGRFAVSFVGASYGELVRDLCACIGTAPQFKWKATAKPEMAFLHLCELFHNFHPSGNFAHPERPHGSRLRCPYCEPVLLRPSAAVRHR